MELLLEPSLNRPPVAPCLDVSQEWAEARTRVEKYLGLLGIRDAASRQRFTAEVIEQARQHAGEDVPTPPLELAMDELERALRRWFDALPGSSAEFPLSRETLPFAFSLHSFRAVPDRRATAMSPQPLDFRWGAKLARMAERPRFRSLATWAIAGLMLGLIWFLSR